MSLLLNGTDGVTFNDGSEQWAAASPIGTKNLIINGDMRIDQRNAGTSVTPSPSTSTFITDRFFYYANNSNTNLSFQQQSSTPPSDFSFYTRVTANSAGTVASTNEFSYIHRIEGQNVTHLKWGTSDAKTVTLSFWVRSSLTGTFGGMIANSAYNRIYPYSYTISSANTWEKKTITIAGDTTGTWLTTNGIGMQIYWSMGCGATYLGTAGSWGSTLYLGVTGQTNLVQTNGATLDITGVQLEVGDTATPFEHRPYEMELARCHRYYYRQTATDNYENFWNAAGYTATSFYGVFRYPVTMRTAPTINLAPHYNQFCVSVRGANRTLTGFSPNEISASTAQMGTPCATGASQGDAGWVRLENKTPDGTYYLDLNAEL